MRIVVLGFQKKFSVLFYFREARYARWAGYGDGRAEYGGKQSGVRLEGPALFLKEGGCVARGMDGFA